MKAVTGTISPTRHYIEGMLNTLIQLLVLMALILALLSAASIMGVDTGLSHQTKKSLFSGSLEFLGWPIFAATLIAVVLLGTGLLVARLVAEYEDGLRTEQNSIWFFNGLFCSVLLVVVLIGFVLSGWPAVVGTAIGGIPALRGINSTLSR